MQDFIAHDIDVIGETRKYVMMDELIDILKHLKKVDREMDKMWMFARKYLGITKE